MIAGLRGTCLPILIISALLYLTKNIVHAESAENSSPIITFNKFTIQRFNATAYNSWPGVSPKESSSQLGSPFFKVYPLQDRLVIVSPQALINLDNAGQADAQTLINLFASQTPHPETGVWSPEYGTLTFDGTWYGFTGPPLPLQIFSFNLTSNAVQHSPWTGSLPQRIQAAGPSSIIIERRDQFEILRLQGENPQISLPIKPPYPVSYFTASASSGLIAYFDTRSGHVRFLQSTAPEKASVGIPVPGHPFGMTWFGNFLILAYSRKLLVITDPDKLSIHTISHPEIPAQWYNIYGGPRRLVLHSPQNPRLIVISPMESGLSHTNGEDFAVLLKQYAQAATQNLLNKNGRNKQTQAFILWLLPHIRAQRALKPLDPFWPYMENQSQELLEKIRSSRP